MSGECFCCGNHCLDCDCTAQDAAIHYAITELDCVLEDLRGKYDPGDGGVCVRTLVRVIDHLLVVQGWDDNPEWTKEDFVRARPASEAHGAEVAAAMVRK